FEWLRRRARAQARRVPARRAAPRERCFVPAFSTPPEKLPKLRALAGALPEIAARLLATVTIHRHALHAADMLYPFPDEPRKILERRRSQRLDPVEQLVIEHLLHVRDAALELAEINDHSRLRIGLAGDSDLGAERMPMNFLTYTAQ